MAFSIGDRVRLKASPTEKGVVTEGPKQGITSDLYRVFFSNERSPWLSETGLEFDRPEIEVGWANSRQLLRDLAVLKLGNQFNDVLYSMGASRTKFLVYQFQPVLKFVQNLPHGMLIADEVGLGKTIEAGLILKELIARGSVQRVLVVCPANLRQKWRSEMQQRFGLQFAEIGAQGIRQMQRDVDYVGWPSFMGVASLEGLRRQELQEIVESIALQFDLVIIDEAHHLRNVSTHSFDLGALLSDQADHILLLSATPIQTGSGDLLSLLKLIEPEQYGSARSEELEHLLAPNAFFNRAMALLSQPLVSPSSVARVLLELLETPDGRAFEENPLLTSCLNRLSARESLSHEEVAALQSDLKRLHTLAPFFTRTRKREVEASARRRSQVFRVRMSEAEAHFYSAWYAYVVALAGVRTPGAPIAWVSSMRERQAASCLQSAKLALKDMLAGDPVGDVDSSDPDLRNGQTSTSRTSARLEEARTQVIEAAQRLGDADTKADDFAASIRGFLEGVPTRKILVFAFFKGTVAFLKRHLTRLGFRVESMSGDDSPESRADIVARFKDGDANVLLTTEVGSEGLDFQFCDTVVNYDLPWNPMRVEQRIGRIDRYGQTQPFVNVVSFFVEETIDTRILERLYERIQVFEESIGELEPILGPIVAELQAEVFSQELSAEELLRRAEEAVRRAETLKLQYEAFETSRAELLGQGALVRQEIEALRSSGRYVAPDELHALVAEWVEASQFGTDGIRPTSRAGIWDLSLSPTSIGRVREVLQQERRQDPITARLLTRIQTDNHAWCTFDSEVAQGFDNLPFIDVSHPLVRVAFEDARRRLVRDPFLRIGVGLVSSHLVPSSGAFLYLYHLAIKGTEPRDTLLPVVVSSDGEVYEDEGDKILGLLQTVQRTAFPEDLDKPTIESLEEMAFIFADGKRQEAEQWAVETDGARRAAQAASVTRSFDGRVSRKRELSTKVSNERIRRLHEGELRNLLAAKAARLAEIEGAPAPFAELDLLAIIYLTGAG